MEATKADREVQWPPKTQVWFRSNKDFLLSSFAGPKHC
jgi:hypothetical protein